MKPPTQIPPDWPRRHRSASLVFPVILIVAGLILLLNNLGVVPWSIWLSLAQLWPILLILFGIDLLIGRRYRRLGVVVTILMLVLVLGGAFWTNARGVTASSAVGPAEEKTATVPIQGATSGNLTVNLGAGKLDVGALPADSPNLVQASASVAPGMSLTTQSRLENGTATATLQVQGDPRSWWFFGSNRWSGLNANVLLSPKLPETLQFNLGAGQSTLDLTQIPVRELSVNSGAGNLEIRFPSSAGTTTADVHSGAGRVALVIPPGVGAYIHSSNGLVNLHTSPRFTAVADGYQTVDYGTAANRLDVSLHVGVGQVDVQ